MFKHFGLFVLVLALLTSLVPISNSQPQPKNGDISFLPNVIPDLVVTDRPEDKPESFRFEWLGNRFDIEVFFNATYERKGVNETRLFSLLDFEDDFEVSVEYVAEKNGSHCQFGWLVEGVSEVSKFVHNAWFKIEDTKPFDYEDIELETIEPMPPDFNYTITRFHLPDNLVLSFEDLIHKGFVIGWQNKTSTSVKGFSGKTSWNLDPITFSSPIITVTGFTEGTPCNFWDVWNASYVNAWNVSEKTDWGENSQFTFGCQLQIGDGSAETWFADVNTQVVFNSTVVTANSQDLINVRTNGHFRVGKVETVADKTSSSGCHLLALDAYANTRFITGEDSTNADIEVYSSILSAPNNTHILYKLLNNSPIWNNIFDNARILVSSVDIYNLNILKVTDVAGAISYGTIGSIDDVTIFDPTYYYIYLYGVYGGTFQNIIGKNTGYRAFRINAITVDCYVINGDLDVWTFYYAGTSTAEVYRQYEHTFNFTYNINPVENANVTITYEGQGGGKIGSWQTWANGSIPTQTISRSFYNQTGGNTEYAYYPYVLTVTLDGYQTYTKKWTPTEKTTWEIALTPTDTSFNSTYYLLGAITLSPFILLGLYWRKKKNGNRI